MNASVPEVTIPMQNAASQPSAEQQAMSGELRRKAIFDDDWEPYLKNVQLQGMGYAKTGLSFHAWFELIRGLQKYMMPHLLESCGDSPKRLLSAINGMDVLIEVTMGVIGDAYLETKEQLIRLSRVSRAPIEPVAVNLSSLAHNVIRDLQRTHPERIVETLLTPDLIARGDQRLMRVVLENLLNNAWKFASKQEYARIELGVLSTDHQQTFCERQWRGL